MIDYMLIIFSTIMTAAIFACQKAYQKGFGASTNEGFRYSAILGLACALITLAVNKFQMGLTPFSLFTVVLKEAFHIGYTLLGFKIMKRASMSLFTLFIMSGGMIIPYIFGIFYLNETFNVLRFLGLVLILGGVILSNLTKGKFDLKLIIYCIGVFVCNGMVSVCLKIHQSTTAYQTVGTLDYVVLSGLFNFVCSGIFYFATKKNATKDIADEKKKSLWIALLIVLLSASFNSLGSFLQLNGAKNLPASVLYPIITGGAIVFSSLMGRFIFKEKLSKKMLIAIAICFVGTCLFV